MKGAVLAWERKGVLKAMVKRKTLSAGADRIRCGFQKDHPAGHW